MQHPARLSRSAVAILVAGGALRALDWLGNRSLWHDEAALALNLLERDLGGLLAPLDYGQMAPPGFLVLSEAIANGLGHGEPVLRLLPLLAALASLPLFGALARRATAGHAQWLACALFAVSAPLVHYAAEFKPYGGDVTAALVITVLGLRAREADFAIGPCLALAAAGVLLPWFSFGVVFVMAAVGVALGLPLLWRGRGGASVRLLLLVALPWVGSLVTLRWRFLSEMVATPFMQSFWHFSFLPFPPASASDWLWLPERLLWLLERTAGFDPGWVLGAIAAIGGVAAARRAPVLLTIFALPLLLALVASALHLYPFFQRFLFFLVPGLAVLVALGAGAIASRLAPSRRAAPVVLGILLLVWPTLRSLDEVRGAWRPFGLEPVLRALAEQRADGDAIYVYYGAEYVFRYYQQRLALPALAEARHGGSPFASARPRRAWQRWHLDEATGFEPGRTWLVFTNLREWGGESDEERLLAAVERRGRRLARLEATGASATLVEVER